MIPRLLKNTSCPSWIPPVFGVSGGLNIFLGIWVIFSGSDFLYFLGIGLPLYQPFMTWFGIIILMIGGISAICASDSLNKIDVICILLAGKSLCLLSSLFYLLNQSISSTFMLIVGIPEMICIPLFFIALKRLVITKYGKTESNPEKETNWDTLKEFNIQNGESIQSIISASPSVFIFLRGMDKCRLNSKVPKIISIHNLFKDIQGITPILIHATTETRIIEALRGTPVADIFRVSDPSEKIYQTFGVNQNRFIKKFRFSCLLKLFKSRFYQFLFWRKTNESFLINALVFVFKKNVFYRKEVYSLVEDETILTWVDEAKNELRQIADSEKLKLPSTFNKSQKIIFYDFGNSG